MCAEIYLRNIHNLRSGIFFFVEHMNKYGRSPKKSLTFHFMAMSIESLVSGIWNSTWKLLCEILLVSKKLQIGDDDDA
jgi:hypothetical protein